MSNADTYSYTQAFARTEASSPAGASPKAEK
jgi:hypothetical protein